MTINWQKSVPTNPLLLEALKDKGLASNEKVLQMFLAGYQRARLMPVSGETLRKLLTPTGQLWMRGPQGALTLSPDYTKALTQLRANQPVVAPIVVALAGVSSPVIVQGQHYLDLCALIGLTPQIVSVTLTAR